MPYIFTPEQANTFLPEIKSKFNKIINKRDEIIVIQNELNNIINECLPFKNLFEKKKKLNESIAYSMFQVIRWLTL